jgi:hypothetical protein
MTQPEHYVNLASIPELQTILRRGLLSKARIFEAACERGHRLVPVVRIKGRPLALGTTTPRRLRGEPGPGSRWPPAHRASRDGLWLDRPDTIVTDTDGRYIRTIDSEIFTCEDESAEIPFWWLREQIAAGRRRRVIDEATRREMGVMPTSLRGHKHH